MEGIDGFVPLVNWGNKRAYASCFDFLSWSAMVMERSEKALVPEWLKVVNGGTSGGGGNTTSHLSASSSQSGTFIDVIELIVQMLIISVMLCLL